MCKLFALTVALMLMISSAMAQQHHTPCPKGTHWNNHTSQCESN